MIARLVSYRTWIPTVNGRLSFKIIGDSTYPSAVEYANISKDGETYILAIQNRQTSDVLFYRFLARLLNVSGDFTFYVCARARNNEESPDAPLIGRLYVSRSGHEAYRDGAREIERHIGVFRNYDDAGRSSVKLNEAYKQCHRILSQNTDIRANFVLHRDGFFSLSKICWRDQGLARRSLDNAISEGAAIEQIIADQFYFFLRDITHHHQHHGPDADTIITTHKISGRSLRWCNNIVYALYSHIISTKRKLEPAEQVRVLGILAYLQAFKRIVDNRSSQIGLPVRIPEFNDQTIQNSVNATKTYLDLRFAQRKESSDRYRTVLFTLSAAALSLISFVSNFAPEDSPVNPFAQSLAAVVKAYPIIAIGPLIAVLLWWMSDFIVKPKYELKRDGIRLAIANRGVAAGVLLCVAAILGLASYHIIF